MLVGDVMATVGSVLKNLLKQASLATFSLKIDYNSLQVHHIKTISQYYIVVQRGPEIITSSVQHQGHKLWTFQHVRFLDRDFYDTAPPFESRLDS